MYNLFAIFLFYRQLDSRIDVKHALDEYSYLCAQINLFVSAEDLFMAVHAYLRGNTKDLTDVQMQIYEYI